MRRHNLRLIDGGLSAQLAPKPSPLPASRSEPSVDQIADGITNHGKFLRFSPALRQKLAELAADIRTRKPGSAA
jgi:hypothetical protein